MAITFDDPPINEVALGRIFLPRPDFLLPYYGEFWSLVRNQFPEVSHAPPIIAAEQQQQQEASADDAYIFPRVWLLSEDSTRVVQIQRDRFYFNWRQGPERTEYIRFPPFSRRRCVCGGFSRIMSRRRQGSRSSR